MATLIPGQARFLRLPDPTGMPRVALLLCDSHERVPTGRCSFKLRAGVLLAKMEALTVASVVVMIRLLVDAEERFYVAWIDELAPSGAEVLESLANQEDLTVWFSPPNRQGAVCTLIPNVLQAAAKRHLEVVLETADHSSWDSQDFAAGRSLLESQYPTAESLWQRLKGQE